MWCMISSTAYIQYFSGLEVAGTRCSILSPHLEITGCISLFSFLLVWDVAATKSTPTVRLMSCCLDVVGSCPTLAYPVGSSPPDWRQEEHSVIKHMAAFLARNGCTTKIYLTEVYLCLIHEFLQHSCFYWIFVCSNKLSAIRSCLGGLLIIWS